MADVSQVTFRAARWSMLAARDLTRIADMDQSDVRIFAAGVEQKRFQLLDVLYRGRRIGCVIWCIEHEGENVGVVVNAAACAPVRGVDMTGVITDTFAGIAKQIGAVSLRCWTARPGLKRKLERRGFSHRYVMEKGL